MITRPLDLASRLRPEPRNLDAFFFVNAGLLALFFSLFGSQFVVAPGLNLTFRLPSVVGANANARAPTHVINVLPSGQIITSDGLRKIEELRLWLDLQAKTVPAPVLLIRGSLGVPLEVLADIVSAAKQAGFADVILAAEERTAAPGLPPP
jgi:biopolymer transport protein ExbD